MIATDIIFFSLFGVIFIVLYYVSKRLLSNNASYSFQDSEKTDMPYISLDIQGKQFNMIADSAASVSILRKEALNQLSVYESSPRKVSLTAITNDEVRSNVISVPININGKEIKTDFVVYDGGDIADFGAKHGVTIHGILGVEFFKKTKGIVDFKKQTVTFPKL